MCVRRHLSKPLGAQLSNAKYDSPRVIDGTVPKNIATATVTRQMLDEQIDENAWSRFARLIALRAVHSDYCRNCEVWLP